MDIINIAPERISTVIINPDIAYNRDKEFHCTWCGNHLFNLNRKFAISTHGTAIGVYEVPLNVFKMVYKCKPCGQFYVIILDGVATDLL